MAIRRLLSPKLTPHFSSRGFIPLTRMWFSSSLEDDRKHERLSDSEASCNKDIGKKGMYWYSLGGLLTNLKQKIIGNTLFINKTSGEDSVQPKLPIVSSADVTATKVVVSLQNVAENQNCNPLSKKEELLVSEMGSQDGSQSNMFINPGSNEKGQSDKEKPHQNKHSNMLSDAVQKSGSLASFLPRGTSHDQQSVDLAAIRERRTDNGTDADAISWNPNGGEGKCVPKGNSVTKKSDCFFAMEEEESKGETLVLQNQSLCSQVTSAATITNPELTKKSLDALSVGEHSPNKVLLRFLKERFEKKDIIERFSEFGAVLDVQEIPSFEGCIYKDALLTFETKSAVNAALKKAVVPVKNYNAVVEATSQQRMVERICIPDLIGDPDVPIALVKEPTRTVKIHPLEHDMSSNQIKEALWFCRSDISKFMLGSSRTATFVEFKTEDGKERALAAHSISIFNKQLFISRIDIPRTTVVRISNLSVLAMNDIRKLCLPYGQIKKVVFRGKGIVDVHFDVSEWPNMLTILNSLNGKEVDGMKWVVRPSTTVIPHEILRVLWKDPQEKKYVRGLIQNLVREIEKPLDASPLAAIHL